LIIPLFLTVINLKRMDMKPKLMIISSAIAVLGLTAILGLSSFSEQKSQHQYLSLTANMYGNSYEIHLIDETGQLEKIELSGTPGRRNNIEWEKFVWKKVNEVSKTGYKLILSNHEIPASTNAVPRYSYIFEKA
jgi:hypothetical protein